WAPVTGQGRGPRRTRPRPRSQVYRRGEIEAMSTWGRGVGQLDGRVAVVTGAGQNIGRAVALRFAAEGAAVAIEDRDAPRGESVCNEVTSGGGRAISIVADVSLEADARRAVDRTVAELGDLHILVNNAAKTINKP